jgi:structural maintenance of chromosome 2
MIFQIRVRKLKEISKGKIIIIFSIANETENFESNKREISEIEKKIKTVSENLKKLDVLLIEKKDEMTKNETEINTLKQEREKVDKKREELISEQKNIEIKMNKYDKEIKDSKVALQNLQNENKWIASEKSFFGMKDTDYDFTNIDSKAENEKKTKLIEENKILKRKVNMKVDVMADQYENKYNELINKKEIIIKDKANIEKAIIDMDQKRKDALEEIYEQVDKNLNSIYSTLLPGTKAKLGLLPDKGLMDGLELRVAFNNVWKKSLSELSGGQRSLLALSLILALLLYKPAPFYILDEIDAALDLSHTANLGYMIKEHFPQSQFIVVSLKDGMFNNANVLYKVSFSDGGSKVERISKDDNKKNFIK